MVEIGCLKLQLVGLGEQCGIEKLERRRGRTVQELALRLDFHARLREADQKSSLRALGRFSGKRRSDPAEPCLRLCHPAQESGEQDIGALFQPVVGLLVLQSFLLREKPPSEPAERQRHEKNEANGRNDDVNTSEAYRLP